MVAPALLPLVLIAATPQFANNTYPDPAVEVWLDSEARYERGDRARVYARTARDGYLIVLHADTDGRVRVLFPLDPWLDDFVRGGEGIELRTRGDREAFLVEDRDGSGIVLAAWSPDPFRFDAFVRGDHWDYRAIAPEGVRSDPEAALLDVVHTMAEGRSYEYNVATYLVGRDAYDRYTSPVYVDRWKSRVDWRLGFGSHSGFFLNINLGTGLWYDPWFHDPWYDPWWHHGPRFVIHHPVWYRPIFYDPYYYAPFHHRRVVVWDPFLWRYRHRGFGPGIGVHIRYAGGDCRGSWNCWRDPFPRPGRATGIAFGNDGAGWPYGRIDDGDPRPGIGRGRAQPRNGIASVRANDPQQDLGRERPALRGIAQRATVPVATSTTEARRQGPESRRTPIWPGDANGRSNTIRAEPPRSRNASDVIRRTETATSTETRSDPSRSNRIGIGRRAIEPSTSGDPVRSDPGRSLSSRWRILESPGQSRAAERAVSTGQSRDSRSISSRGGSDASRAGARVIEPSSRSSISRSGVTSRVESRSEPPSRASSARSETARSSDPAPRSSSVGTRIIRSSPPQARSEARSSESRSSRPSGISRASTSRIGGSPSRPSSGRIDRAPSRGTSSRVGGTPSRATSRIGGSPSRASSSGSARSSGSIGSRARGGAVSRGRGG